MDCNCKGHPLNCSKHPHDCGCNAGLTAESILTEEQFLAIGSLLDPVFEKLPPIPMHAWHRFSFDVVQLHDGLQVRHVRFVPITPNPHR